MSEVRTFFRHCPACGRRFEIRVVRKEPEKNHSYESEMPRSVVDVAEGRPLTPLVLSQEADKPVIVEDKKLGYTYMCRHCGHQWTEIHDEVHVEARPEEYTGD